MLHVLSLSEDYAIVGAQGPPEAFLRQASGSACRSIDAYSSDGASTRITYGVLNLSHRVSHAKPEPLPLGEVIDVSLTLDQIAYRVPKGHKIRVAVSTSYWPLLWPSPEASTLCLHQGSIDIPLRQSGLKDERIFPPAQTETPWDIEILRPASNARRVIEDMHSGIVTLEILDVFGNLN